MKKLFLAWRSGYQPEACQPDQTRWFPIGELESDHTTNSYTFRYLKGAQKAKELVGFSALEAFPDLNKSYHSRELFSFFKNRIPNAQRNDFKKIIERMDLNSTSPDVFSILSISGGTRQTDCIEIFPELEISSDQSFECKFFVHGSRFMSDDAKKRIQDMRVDQELKIAVEMGNSVTGCAIQIQTKEDNLVIGYAPRYLITDLKHMVEYPEAVEAVVAKVNPAPAPSNQRLLVTLSGKLPFRKQTHKAEEFEALSY